MITSISPTSEIFLSNLQQIENRVSTAERQLSSGLRVNEASDAPDQISNILQLRAQIAGVQQTQHNLSVVGPQVNSADTAIQQATQVLDSATSLATQAANGTPTPAQQAAMASQAEAILQQLVSLSRTNVNGQYIFSGAQSGQPSYGMNGSTYQQLIVPAPGLPGAIQDTNGVSIATGLTASQVFDGGNSPNPQQNSAFAAVASLVTALQENPSNSTDLQSALANIQSATAYVSSQGSFYGAVENNITAANNTASTQLTQLQQLLSNEQEADIPTVSQELQSALTSEQAAMQGQAQFKPQSLFSYLS